MRGRLVTVVLAGPDGEIFGALPPFEVDTPWWQEVGGIAERTGAQVLRLLAADRPHPPGGRVTYLAETSTRPAGLVPVEISVEPHPLRVPYARPGGPRTSIAWARAELARHEDVSALPVRQVRTWNLSAIWRVGDAWLKQVPSFFAHEPAAIRLVDEVAPGVPPRLLASGDEGRMLLAHAPGEDGYGAGASVCERIAEAFHPVQRHFSGNVGRMAAAGIPDQRDFPLDFALPYVASIPGLADLLDDVPRRRAELAACGLPDTLVHGDLHPGNARVGDRLTIMDWGDCFIGNPAYDVLRLTEHLDDPAPLIERWAARWRRDVPGSDPERAADLIRPLSALRSAYVYATFLADIEPTEHPYHAADVPERLTAAVALARR